MYAYIKRGIDFVFSFLGLVVLSPVFLVVAAGVAGLCVRAAKGGLKE